MPNKTAVVKVDIDIVKEFGIEPSIASQIEAVFSPMVKGLKGFEKEYSTLMKLADKGVTPEVCAAAKRLRLGIGKVRISADKAREKEKKQYLLGGRAVDGVFSILKFAVNQKEDKLKAVEEHFERQEQAEREKIAEARREELDKYEFNYSTVDLVNMENDVYVNFVTGIKLAWELKEAAEKQAEIDRIERERKEEEERQRLEDENAAFREKEIERKRLETLWRFRLSELEDVLWNGEEAIDNHTGEVVIDADKMTTISDAAFKKFMTAHNKKAKAARAVNAEQEKKDIKAREDADRIKRENEAREEEEREREEAAKKARITAAQAPDKQKILALIDVLASVDLPNLKSIKGKELMSRLGGDLILIDNYLKTAESEM